MRSRFAQRHLTPTRTIVLSFASVIVAGTILLLLPPAAAPGRQIRIIDAFFTAASATCVTGLTVLDTGRDFSRFGQLVILACIQVGGLGLMAFTTVFLVASGRRLAIADRAAIFSSFHHTPVESPAPLIRYIVLGTLIVEAAGALLLGLRWGSDGRFSTAGETAYWSVFHAVSAFCNAGFGLSGTSLVMFQHDPFTLLVLSGLIIVGGLGFLVGLDLWRYARDWIRAWSRSRDSRRPVATPILSVHAKLVLIGTSVLLVLGTVAFYALERDGVFARLSASQAWLNAWFCAVTPRTAGFNTVVFAEMGGAALLCTMVLMLIGASPGSTGGGLKTSTFALLFAYAASRWKGHARLHMFNRTIPQESLDKASAIVVLGVVLLVIAGVALSLSETGGPRIADEERRLVALMFEAVSAFGTVGLSLGATPHLSDTGKLIIVALMFIGRIGPLTLGLAISRRRNRAQYRFAEENVMIG